MRRLRRELGVSAATVGRRTALEADVPRLVADGLDTAGIASRLAYSERTYR